MGITNPKTPKPHTQQPWGREERRQQRQAEAIERKEARAKRTPQEQLDILAARGVTSGREYTRLVAMIEGTTAKDENTRRAERRKKFKKVTK